MCITLMLFQEFMNLPVFLVTFLIFKDFSERELQTKVKGL